MVAFSMVSSDGIQILVNEESRNYYLTLPGIAKMMEISLEAAEVHVRKEVAEGRAVYLGPDGVDYVIGNYLIPICHVFTWLLLLHPAKAIDIGSGVVVEALVSRFSQEISKSDIQPPNVDLN